MQDKQVSTQSAATTQATQGQGTAAQAVATQTGASNEGANTQWYYADGVPGVGDKPDFLIDGKYKTVAEQAKAYKAKQSEFDSKLKGFAGAPEKYEVKLSDDLKGVTVETEDPLFKQFTEFAKDNNMTNEAYNNLVNLYVKNSMEQNQAEQAHMEQELQKLGEKTVTELPVLDQWGKNNLPSDLYDAFRGMVNSADAAKVFLHLKNISGPTKLPNATGAAQENLTPTKLREMLADPKYRSDMQYRKEVDTKYKMFYQSN